MGRRGATAALPTVKLRTPTRGRVAPTVRGNVPLNPKLRWSPARLDYFHWKFYEGQLDSGCMRSCEAQTMSADTPEKENNNCNHKLDICSGRYFCTKVLSVKGRMSPFSADFWIGTPAPYFTQAQGVIKQTKEKGQRKKTCTR